MRTEVRRVERGLAKAGPRSQRDIARGLASARALGLRRATPRRDASATAIWRFSWHSDSLAPMPRGHARRLQVPFTTSSHAATPAAESSRTMKTGAPSLHDSMLFAPDSNGASTRSA